MSVIVKGMDMPKSCASCRMAVCFADTGRAKCYATLSYIDPERGKRSYDCPLVELPEKHGRLVDADTLSDEYILLPGEVRGFRIETLGVGNGRATLRFKQWKDVPTVVEAEGDDS